MCKKRRFAQINPTQISTVWKREPVVIVVTFDEMWSHKSPGCGEGGGGWGVGGRRVLRWGVRGRVVCVTGCRNHHRRRLFVLKHDVVGAPTSIDTPQTLAGVTKAPSIFAINRPY